MNEGAAAASGDLLLFLNDDTELIEPDSIQTLVGLVTGPSEGTSGPVGMVGAKLLFDDGTVQHGGPRPISMALITRAQVGRAPRRAPLPLRPLAVARECSGVTAAVAMMSADLFNEVGGFPEELPLNYNDVDLSLRVRAAGYRIVWDAAFALVPL